MIQQRIDWLTLAYRCELAQHVVTHLQDTLQRAQSGGSGRAAVSLGGVPYELRATRSAGRCVLTNADIVMTLDQGPTEGWAVAVEYSGSRISQLELHEALRRAHAAASELGIVKATRIRRLDLCADVAGFDLDALDGSAWIKPRRAKLAAIQDAADVEKAYEPGRRTFERGGRVTGVQICPGNAVMLLCYDKREELQALPDDRKRNFEETIWRAAGWNGTDAVARVEFRFRSEALHELGVRDKPEQLGERLDSLWKYACKKWCRLVVRGSASKLSNCRVDERWHAIQSVIFQHQSAAALRVRLRGGASSAHAFGTALSRLAVTGEVPPPVPFVDEHGQAIADDARPMFELPDWEARAGLEVEVEKVLARLARPIARDFENRFKSVHRAALFVRTRTRAATARFASTHN